MAVGGHDGIVRVWRLSTGDELAFAAGSEPVTAVQFSTDSASLVVATARSAATFDLRTAQPVPRSRSGIAAAFRQHVARYQPAAHGAL